MTAQTPVADVLSGAARFAMLRGESLALLKTLPDASVDAVVTDPPYSSGGFTRGDRTDPASKKYVQNGTILERPEFAGDNRDQRGFEYWCVLWLAECLRVAKPGAPICVFTDWRQLPTTTDAVQAGGWVWRGIVAWDKTRGCRPTMGRFASQCEYIVWGSAGPMPQRTDVGCLWGCISEPVDQQDKHHITGKPTRVMQELVKVCPPGGLVLDPFAGSGTTGVAAPLEGRRFVGVEITDANCKVARDRLEAAAANVSLDAYRAGQLPLLGGP